MRKAIAVIIAVSIMIVGLFTGCTPVTDATSDTIGITGTTSIASDDTVTKLDLSTIKWSNRIIRRHLHTSNTVMIISGTSDLPDGTIIQSQLYENYVPLTWWPSDQEFVIEDGELEIKVLLEETVPHDDFIPESGYWLIIRVKDDPSIVDGVFWDTIGPPAAE